MTLNPIDQDRFEEELVAILEAIASLGGNPEELIVGAMKRAGREVEDAGTEWRIAKPRLEVDVKDIARRWIQKNGQDLEYIDHEGIRDFAEREDLTSDECHEVWCLIRDASVRIEFL
jgi:hypothetical protein